MSTRHVAALAVLVACGAPKAIEAPSNVTTPPAQTRSPVVIEERGLCNRHGWCWQNPLPQGKSLNGGIVIGGDLYAAGENGLVMRFDGTRWTRLDTDSLAFVYDVWGTSRDDLFASMNGGKIRHWDGTPSTAARGPPRT